MGLIWFYAALLWFGSRIMIACVSKHVGIVSMILQYKYLRNNFVHFVCLVLWISYGQCSMEQEI
jgi:hypothetical protein